MLYQSKIDKYMETFNQFYFTFVRFSLSLFYRLVLCYSMRCFLWKGPEWIMWVWVLLLMERDGKLYIYMTQCELLRAAVILTEHGNHSSMFDVLYFIETNIIQIIAIQSKKNLIRNLKIHFDVCKWHDLNTIDSNSKKY